MFSGAYSTIGPKGTLDAYQSLNGISYCSYNLWETLSIYYDLVVNDNSILHSL